MRSGARAITSAIVDTNPVAGAVIEEPDNEKASATSAANSREMRAERLLTHKYIEAWSSEMSVEKCDVVIHCSEMGGCVPPFDRESAEYCSGKWCGNFCDKLPGGSKKWHMEWSEDSSNGCLPTTDLGGMRAPSWNQSLTRVVSFFPFPVPPTLLLPNAWPHPRDSDVDDRYRRSLVRGDPSPKPGEGPRRGRGGEEG